MHSLLGPQELQVLAVDVKAFRMDSGPGLSRFAESHEFEMIRTQTAAALEASGGAPTDADLAANEASTPLDP